MSKKRIKKTPSVQCRATTITSKVYCSFGKFNR